MFTLLPRKVTRVKVVEDIVLEPYATLRKGERGTLIHSEVDGQGVYEVDILMDKQHKGLAAWNNEAHLAFPELAAIEYLKSPRTVTVPLTVMVASLVLGMATGGALAEAGSIVSLLHRWIL